MGLRLDPAGGGRSGGGPSRCQCGADLTLPGPARIAARNDDRGDSVDRVVELLRIVAVSRVRYQYWPARVEMSPQSKKYKKIEIQQRLVISRGFYCPSLFLVMNHPEASGQNAMHPTFLRAATWINNSLLAARYGIQVSRTVEQ